MTTYTINFYNVSPKNASITRKVRNRLRDMSNWMLNADTAQRTTTENGTQIFEILDNHFSDLKQYFNHTCNLTITDENMNRFFYTKKGII